MKHLFFAISVLLASTAAADSLNTSWQLARDGAATPAELAQNAPEWTDVSVPSFVAGKPQIPLWYRCSFTLPEEMKGAEKVYLQFGGVKFATDVWLDGKKLGSHVGGFERFRFPLPTTSGTHDLLVRVEGLGAICRSPLPWEKFLETGEISTLDNRLMYPVGSGHRNLGIWEDVTLVPEGKVSVADLFLQTSVRKGEITVDLTLQNETATTLSANVTLSLEPLQNEKVPTFVPRKISLSSHASTQTTWKETWNDALQWNPEHPHLYFLTVTVTSPSGEVLAKHRERFGFREFWCEGPDFYLNGVKMHLLATAKHPSSDPNDLTKEAAKEYFAKIREANCNAMRLHANVWPRAWYEAADEVGLPLVLESSLFCYSAAYALDDDGFWKNMETHMQSLLKRHRNNPSVVIVSLCNEILHCGGTQYAADCEQRLAKLGVFVKQCDPTRPIMFDGDMDPKLSPDDPTGVADIINPHYPIDFSARGKSNGDTNLPESFWWIDRGKVMACYPGTFWKWDRKKPLYFGEFLHLQHFQDMKPYALLLGDKAFGNSFDAVMAQTKAIAWRMQIEAYRAAGVSGMCPWTLAEPGPWPVSLQGVPNPRFDAVRESYEPITFFVRPFGSEKISNIGDRQTLEIDFYNDTLHEQELVFTWCSGKEKTGGTWKFTLPPAGHVMKTLEITLTAPMHPVQCRLTAPTTREWSRTFLTRRPHSDREKNILENLSVGVWDDANSPLVKSLQTQKFKELRVLRSFDEPFPEGCLIVGKNRLKSLFDGTAPSVGNASGYREKISRFLEQGGIFLVLPQEEYPLGFLPVTQVDLDLPYWWECEMLDTCLKTTSPKTVVHRPFVISQSMNGDGNLFALGGPNGMDYTHSIVRRVGKGVLVLSQVMEEDFHCVLEGQTIQQACRETGKIPRPMAVIDPTGTMAPVLRRTDFVWEDVTETYRKPDFDASRYALLLVHADASPAGLPFEKLPIVVHGLTPENLAPWHTLVSGGMVLLKNVASVSWPGNNFSLYWLARRAPGMSWRRRTLPADDVAPWVIQTTIPDPAQSDKKQVVPYDGLDEIQKPRSFVMKKDAWFSSTALNFTHTFRNVEGRQFVLELDAKGTPMAGVGVLLRVSIGGKPVGTVELANSWGKPARLAFEADPVDGNLPVTVSFINDAWDPVTREDRNLEFRSMTLLPATCHPQLVPLTTPAAVVSLSEKKVFFDQVNWTAPQAPEQARQTRYLHTLLSHHFVEMKSPLEALLLPGSVWTPGNSRFSVRQNAMVMGSNGMISQKVVFGAGKYRFTLNATGTSEGGIYPHVTLCRNQKPIGEFQLDSEEGRYTTTAEIPEGSHEISLHFDNDHWNPETKEDRNLRILSLEIEGWKR
ncbi:MAG: carbohydrate-binding domain-containing protein [Planctomycetia bacterium]|nr:carbohydrate-binding domain-containing protein [Planctomycetia bacterium]